MKVLTNFNLNNNDHLTDLVIYPPTIQPNKTYWIIGIENELLRVINDNLDPVLIHPIFFEILDYQDVSNWQQTINKDEFYFIPKTFAQYPYFWEILHDGSDKNSLQYADVYMAYLASLLGKEYLCKTLEMLYLQSINDNVQHFSFWQKSWLKYIFNVKNAIEIRQFMPNFQTKIYQYLEQLTWPNPPKNVF